MAGTFHYLCREGDLRKVQSFVGQLPNKEALLEELRVQKGTSSYTPLHEAVSKDHYEVLEYLLALAGQGFGDQCLAGGGTSLLHLAAASGHTESARILLRHGVDVRMTDSDGRTAIHRAEQRMGNEELVQLLKCEELIQEVRADGKNVTHLLRTSRESYTTACLNKALLAAVKKNNHANVGKLVLVGATNTEEGLVIATEQHKYHARGMLLLIKAVKENDLDLLKKLFGETSPELDSSENEGYSGSQFAQVQSVVSNREVLTVVPLEVARRNGNIDIREELLVRTDVNKNEGTVHWHGLRLLSLYPSVLPRISWVKKLKLARNCLQSLPATIGTILTKVTKIDLSYNELESIPPGLLELPCLLELNLLSNKLTEIPAVLNWSPALAVLDLSRNQLVSLPGAITAPGISSLDLGHNKLRGVPESLCTLTSLNSLDLSWNIDILALPDAMGLLKNLNRLDLTGLPNLHDPPESVRGNCRECIQYLRSRFRGSKPFNSVKVVVMGCPEGGKSTLASALSGKERTKSFSQEARVEGLHVSKWQHNIGKRTFNFTVWELGGGNMVIHQCFISDNSLNLLVFNLLEAEKGLEGLKPWLDAIALRAPKSLVMIIGTHQDRVVSDRQQHFRSVREMFAQLRSNYPRLLIHDLVMVGLSDNIASLKQTICSYISTQTTAEGETVLGRSTPESYHMLYKQLKEVRKQRTTRTDPLVMHVKEFQRMISQLDITDISDAGELAEASIHLAEVGSFLHYQNRSHDLSSLYFIDPSWVYSVLTRIIGGSETVAKCKGVLQSSDMPHLLMDISFPWEYYEQILALLAHFELAVPLSNEYLLVPSALSENRPDTESISELNGDREPPYSYFCLFPSAPTPPGLWSHLLAQVVYFVPQVYRTLVKATGGTTGVSPQNDRRGRSATAQSFHPSSSVGAGFAIGSDLFSLAKGPRPTHPPPLLPNHPSPLASPDEEQSANRMEYWKTGLLFSSSEMTFCIESLSDSSISPQTSREGVLITASRNKHGMKISSLLLDLIGHLISEWYPQLQIRMGSTSVVDVRIPCYLCRKMQHEPPYEFTSEHCILELLGNIASIKCQHDITLESNHESPLKVVAPHLLFLDADAQLLLDHNDIEPEASVVLGKGAFSKVYRGRYKHSPVAIKKYRSNNRESFVELQQEMRFLSRCSAHPCVVKLVGGCVYPMVAFLMELAPLGSLEKYLVKNGPNIHRIVAHRIAAQVASALHFLHTSGVILRNVRAANVLLWSLSPSHLCHGKLSGFNLATYLPPFGTKGMATLPGFTAPEAQHVNKGKQLSSYTHKVDIFSFGMLLYEIITGRKPYENQKVTRMSAAVEAGEHPSLCSSPLAETSFHCVTRLMQRCWDSTASARPDADHIAHQLCLSPVQLVKLVHPVRNIFSLRHACITTCTHFGQAAGEPQTLNDLWICSDGKEGAEFNIYSLTTMTKTNTNFISENRVQCMCVCGDHVWVGCTAGIKYGEIHVFNVSTAQIVVSIKLGEHSLATCIASTDDAVYIGTVNGQCFLYNHNVEQIQASALPVCECKFDESVDSIIATQNHIWISHAQHISVVHPEDLTQETSFQGSSDNSAPIGQLYASTSKDTVWSVHQSRPILSAWDVDRKVKKFDIDVRLQLSVIENVTSAATESAVITTVAPALDTVWVGMSSGHILMFHENALLNWCRPYTEYIRFLACVPNTESVDENQCTVISGAKGLCPAHPLLINLEEEEEDEQTDSAGVLIVWEAYDAKTMKQIKIVEDNAPRLYSSRITINQVVASGKFEDGEHIMQSGTIRVSDPSSTNTEATTAHHSPTYDSDSS